MGLAIIRAVVDDLAVEARAGCGNGRPAEQAPLG